MKRRALKVAVLLVLVGGVAAVYLSPLRDQFTRAHIRELIDHLRGIWYGPLLLIAMYGIGSIFAIPASIFVIAGGVIWGWKLGSAYAIAGGILGAIAAYFVALFLGEGLLDRFGGVGRAVRKQVDGQLSDIKAGEQIVAFGTQNGDTFQAAIGEDGNKKLRELTNSAVLTSETNIFAFSPKMSYVSKEMIAADPDFWAPKPKVAAKKEKQ